MWLATKVGFFSVIQWHDGRMAIRARSRTHIAKLRKLTEVDLGKMEVTPGKDYRYRVFCTREQWETEVGPALLATINYGNFKSAVDQTFKTSDPYSKACHSAWSVFGRIQPRGPYGLHKTGYPPVPKSEAKVQAKADERRGKPFDYEPFLGRLHAPELPGQDSLLQDLRVEDGELVCDECGRSLTDEDALIVGQRVYCRDVGLCLDNTVRS